MSHTSPLCDPSIVADPYPTYAELMAQAPVHWCDGLHAWTLFRYADCVAALNDPRLKAERMASVLKVKFAGRELPPDHIYHRFTNNVMMYVDPPRHEPLRRSTAPGFTGAAHEQYSDAIAVIASELVNSIAARELDAVAELTSKLPVRAAVRVFGVPEEDLAFILPRVEAIMTYWSGPQDQPLELDPLLENLTDLHDYAHELVQGARGHVLPDTVIARLAAAQPTNRDTTLEQTIHQLVLLLIALFAPTTPGSLSSGTLAFARNPSEIDRFLGDRTCVDNTAHEVIRYNASNQFTWRVAATALEIGGTVIAAGEAVVPVLGAANRDPAMFETPDQFDLRRDNSARHLSFGTGRHSCLGRQIASLEVRWFFVALLARFPKLRLVGDPVWNTNLEFRSLKSLPLGLG